MWGPHFILSQTLCDIGVRDCERTTDSKKPSAFPMHKLHYLYCDDMTFCFSMFSHGPINKIISTSIPSLSSQGEGMVCMCVCVCDPI